MKHLSNNNGNIHYKYTLRYNNTLIYYFSTYLYKSLKLFSKNINKINLH